MPLPRKIQNLGQRLLIGVDPRRSGVFGGVYGAKVAMEENVDKAEKIC